jgi:hypothetical protein
LCCSSERLPGFSAVSRGCTDITPWSPGNATWLAKGMSKVVHSLALLQSVVRVERP